MCSSDLDAVADQPPPREVLVTITDRNDLTIQVQDNGPGVDPVNAEAIFTDGFTTKTARGERRRGIGLALVRRLVTRAGGTITVDGPGARFEVVLPPAAVNG